MNEPEQALKEQIKIKICKQLLTARQTFLQALEKSHKEWKEKNERPEMEVSEGPSCTPDGNCN